MTTPAPRSEQELLERANRIAGQSLGALAQGLHLAVPSSQARAKGWVGTLMEQLLGASAASRPEPDFQLIGVELKTIPVTAQGTPRESTYVCTVPLVNNRFAAWYHSWVYHKLRRVLWFPVEAETAIPLAERRVGMPLLWSPDKQEEAALRSDWEELMDMVCLGQVEAITAHHGSVLQIRPKAANAKARRSGIGIDGTQTKTLPRGFYLRPSFTRAIFERNFVL